MTIDPKINQANGRLKSANIRVRIERVGSKLYLRASLPPRPDSNRVKPHQQRIPLGINATPSGLKRAEEEARLVATLVDRQQFDWLLYVKKPHTEAETIADWIQRFEQDYFQRRARTPKSETTWETEYLQVFRQLPSDRSLTSDLLKSHILSKASDTRARKRAEMVCTALGKFAGLEADFKSLRGNYSSSSVEPRDLPSDAAIVQHRCLIPSDSWRWVYGVMAAYGLRNHEVFHLDFSRMPILTIMDATKTGPRRVYPIYPEWVDEWNLANANIPVCTGKTNRDLGSRVTKAFTRYKIPFTPYDLRHCWAVRSIDFLPVELAAQQMGHSLSVHSRIYHAWINDEVHERAYRLMMSRSDRPKPPLD
ncbi:site-specific integrase [Phormidesmis sp. 146-12]